MAIDQQVIHFFKRALTKTRELIRDAFSAEMPEEVLAGLEDRLILADVGPDTTHRILEDLKKSRPGTADSTTGSIVEIRRKLAEILRNLFCGNGEMTFAPQPPTVWFLLGTNGSGKTTTAAKLAHRYRIESRQTVLVAADTFRAAAIDQLKIWAGRAGVPCFSMRDGAHPAAVIFDALSNKQIRSSDLVIVDTAGRIHTKLSLMEELSKMIKSCDKAAPGALTEKLLVLDSTTGQNAIAQARSFHQSLNLTGFIVTKLDASAKGGFLLALAVDLPDVPVKWIGMGEGIEDMAPFDPAAFVEGLIGGETG